VPWWCKSRRHEPSQKGPEEPWQGAVLTEEAATPGSPESFSPPGCRAQGPLSWSRSSGHLAKMAQRSPGKGPCSVLQRKAKNPRGHLLAHLGGKKSLPSPSYRAREAIFMVQAQQAVTQPKWTRGALTRGHDQCCRGRQKTPGDQCQSAPGENSFLIPDLAISYSLSMGARPASWSHRLVMPPWRR